MEEATIRLARLVEGDCLRAIPVGPPEPWPGSLAYLDGVQRSEVVGYAGSVNGTSATADAISRWILTERAPVSAPDRRWDRLVYGVYSVEQSLKSRA